MPWVGPIWHWTPQEEANLIARMRAYNALSPEDRAAVDAKELGVRTLGPAELVRLCRQRNVPIPERPAPHADPEVHDPYDTLCILAGSDR